MRCVHRFNFWATLYTDVAQMEWHTGTTLTQTIYTFLYIYHYDELDPEILPYIPLDQRDPARPMELVTLVLRSAVAGFMKCCDMVWRELNKGKVFDVRALSHVQTHILI